MVSVVRLALKQYMSMCNNIISIPMRYVKYRRRHLVLRVQISTLVDCKGSYILFQFYINQCKMAVGIQRGMIFSHFYPSPHSILSFIPCVSLSPSRLSPIFLSHPFQSVSVISWKIMKLHSAHGNASKHQTEFYIQIKPQTIFPL